MTASFFLIIIIYFLPTLVAMNRKRDNTTAIFALNLLGGWTMIGWLVALVWATTLDEEEKEMRRAKRKSKAK